MRSHLGHCKGCSLASEGSPISPRRHCSYKKSEFYPRRPWQEGTGGKKEVGTNSSVILSGCLVWGKAFCDAWEL